MKKCFGEHCFWLSDWGDTATLSIGKTDGGTCNFFLDKKQLAELVEMLIKATENKDWSQGNDQY